LAVAELFIGVFRRDLLAFYPGSVVEPTDSGEAEEIQSGHGPNFSLIRTPSRDIEGVSMFGRQFRLRTSLGRRFSDHDARMIEAVGAVLGLRYHHLFLTSHASRLELYRGGSEDHYVAAYVEPSTYATPSGSPSRIASTINTLRTAALSTYENHRVSTGALLLGLGEPPVPPEVPTAADALAYGVELTSLKSIHRLCDGKRTVYLVDREGRLAQVVDIKEWADACGCEEVPEIPCAREYVPHARATRAGGRVCLVLSPNQEIKLFAGGVQAFSFSHGRWRILDPARKFTVWQNAVKHSQLARVLLQSALDLAESRKGGLFVVVEDPEKAIGRLVAPHDVLSVPSQDTPPAEITPGDPLAKRALHYLARDCNVCDLAPAVLEAMAGLDGAIATDPAGRLLAFGAILRHDPAALPSAITSEGARTTAALVASWHGPVLKVSEDGVVSCFLRGVKVWDL
jgi:hypothetical protein